MKCNLCPRNCNVDRDKGELGYCQAPENMVIARYSRHMWEEPVLSGDKGSGTIFFSYCNMRCCFCQNYALSELHKGRVVSIEEFAKITLDLQNSSVYNINLVTPTMFVPNIIKGIQLARDKGLVLPVVYNTSSYESVNTIRKLDGYVDIYLPDLKYYDNELGIKYSNTNNYFYYASRAIDEMVRQVGKFVLDDNGMMIRGVIVRHMVMPGCVEDSKKIIKYLYDTYHDDIMISIMSQYTPVRECQYFELNRKISEDEYTEVVNYAYDLGVRNAFIQEGSSQDQSFIPDFDVFRDVS